MLEIPLAFLGITLGSFFLIASIFGILYIFDRLFRAPVRDVTKKSDERMMPVRNDQLRKFIVDTVGPLQTHVLEKGFDIHGAKAVLARRFAAQVEIGRRHKDFVSNQRDLRLLRPEFANAAYLAGRGGLSREETRHVLVPVFVSANRYGRGLLLMNLFWIWGRIDEFFLGLRYRARSPFYARRSAENLKPNVVNGFHLDALVDDSLQGALTEQTKQHFLKRVENWSPKEKGKDILVVRANKEALSAALMQLTADPAKMSAYLAKGVTIVQVPARALIKPSDILNEARKQGAVFPPNNGLRFNLYTAMPDQIDMHDELVRFVIYSLLPGLMVVPVSEQLESAHVVSLNA